MADQADHFTAGMDRVFHTSAGRHHLNSLAACDEREPDGRRRRGFARHVPIPFQLVMMFFVGVGMTIATFYWMGRIQTARELRLQAENLTQRETILRLELEAAWSKHDALVSEIIKLTEADLEAGHLADAYEVLIGLESIVAATAEHDREILDTYHITRLDGVVMPTLRLVFQVDKYGGDDELRRVRDILAALPPPSSALPPQLEGSSP